MMCQKLNLRSARSIAFVFDRLVNLGPTGASFVDASVGHGKPLPRLAEFDYIQRLPTFIQQSQLADDAKELAEKRFKKIIENDQLAITNFSLKSYVE